MGRCQLDASLFGDHRWVPAAIALVLGLGLVVALTLRLGGWFQSIDFGEGYRETFNPVSGYALGWWRLVCQLGALFLVVVIASTVEDEATRADVSNAATEALPEYAARVPTPPRGEPFGEPTFSQSTYEERPNATVGRSYVVQVPFGRVEAEAYLASPGWADGVGATPPIGALRTISCDDDAGDPFGLTCEAEVVPPDGGPVEYAVTLSLSEVTTRAESGETSSAGLLDVEVAYEDAPGG